MRLKLNACVRIFLILVACSTPTLAETDKKFDSFGAINCEDEMARLDAFAIELTNMADARAYIFIYGGKRGTFRDEVRVRGARMKRYLIENRGLSPKQIEIVKGGYREAFMVDLFVIPSDQSAPMAFPTVDPKSVRFKKGKMARYRELGCFPGKYLKAMSHHVHAPGNK